MIVKCLVAKDNHPIVPISNWRLGISGYGEHSDTHCVKLEISHPSVLTASGAEVLSLIGGSVASLLNFRCSLGFGVFTTACIVIKLITYYWEKPRCTITCRWYVSCVAVDLSSAFPFGECSDNDIGTGRTEIDKGIGFSSVAKMLATFDAYLLLLTRMINPGCIYHHRAR